MIVHLRHYIAEKLTKAYLPCYVLGWKPPVVFAYDMDFIKNAAEFAACFRKYDKVFLFLQLGWQQEKAENVEKFASELHRINAGLPMLEMTVLTNSPLEESNLLQRGIRAVFCHQNAFLDENRYRIIPGVKKCYDAVYVARISPFKRHELAKGISSLRLIGDYYRQRVTEKEYAEKVLNSLSHAVRTEKVSALKIPYELAKCRCGLCLSAEEGAMFVSAEYLLCGLPLVNTRNIGGRDWIFPEFAVKNVEDTPDAVAGAVREWAQCPPPPEAVRRATLDKMMIHRNTLRRLLGEIRPELKDAVLPNKLSLRCTRMPWINWFHGLKRRG